MFVSVSTIFSQSNADKILGYYYFKEPDSKDYIQVQIYKNAENLYDGKIVWTEKHNQYLGYVFLKDFRYNADKEEWDQGFMYNPATDKKYRGYMKFETYNRLKVRGYIGVSLIGQSIYWTKEKEKRK